MMEKQQDKTHVSRAGGTNKWLLITLIVLAVAGPASWLGYWIGTRSSAESAKRQTSSSSAETVGARVPRDRDVSDPVGSRTPRDRDVSDPVGSRTPRDCIAGHMRTVTLPGGAKLELVWCPAGLFTMGSPVSEEGRSSDETQHRVTLTKGFWIGKYEVTQEQWKSVMGTNPSLFKGARRPVENVSWNDCQKFCVKAGYGLRLPTEAEWEYACRAGSTTAYCWGNALNGDRANCNGTRPCGTMVKGANKEETTEVGSYPSGRNVWGIYDMHGNVSEWCQDWYDDYPDGAVTDPTGPASCGHRVDRGGSWSCIARGCRSASRGLSVPGFRRNYLGFRVCCSAGSYK